MFLAFLALMAAPVCSATAPSGILAEFPAAADADLLVVPAEVGGRRLSFLLDTGSALDVLDVSLSTGVPVGRIAAAPPSGAPVEKSLYAAPGVSVGGLPLPGPVLYNDFAPLRAVSGRDIYGLLGMRFLARTIVQIDLDAGVVRLLDPRTEPRADWGQALPMEAGQEGVPAVRAALPGGAGESFVLDTGDNGGGSLARQLFRDLFPRPEGRTANLQFTGLGAASFARLPELKLGSATLSGLIVESAGLSSLGMGLFRRATVVLDFQRGTLYLKPGRRWNTPEEADMSGLHLLRRQGEILALAVDPGSPAERAGMKPGDIVLGEDLLGLRRLLRSADGRQVTLRVRRGKETSTATLRLKRAF